MKINDKFMPTVPTKNLLKKSIVNINSNSPKPITFENNKKSKKNRNYYIRVYFRKRNFWSNYRYSRCRRFRMDKNKHIYIKIFNSSRSPYWKKYTWEDFSRYTEDV